MEDTRSGYLRHRENRENGQKKSLSGKTQGIWQFCQNTGKTQRISSEHRENTGNFVSSSCKCSDSKCKGYCDSCRKKKKIHFFSRSWISLPSQFCVCNTHKLCKLAQGKFAVGQGKYNLSGYPGRYVSLFVLRSTPIYIVYMSWICLPYIESVLRC